MIIAAHEGHLQVVTQNDHAHFAGELLALWRTDGMPDHPRRLDQGEPVDGIGARRLIGESGVVLEAIPGGGDLGMIRVGREKWRAEAVDERALAAGVPVKIVEIRGTRAVVWPTSEPDPT